jgi:hypothetical protein
VVDLGGVTLDKHRGINILAVGGNSSVVERHLAKVKVAGSNPVSRSFCWRHSQVERRRSAKPLSPGSNPGAALEIKTYWRFSAKYKISKEKSQNSRR